MKFGGIAKTSTIDFPGVLACVLFSVGCNLDCFYCHNRPLIDGNGVLIPEEEVKQFLLRRKGLLDGVVISGGEPTLQPDLYEFCKWVKSLGYQLKLDTNGQKLDVVRQLIEDDLVDYVAVDYKAPAAEYAKICNGDAAKTLDTIQYLLKCKTQFEVRTTVYPALSRQGLKVLLSEVPVVPCYRLNVYRRPDVIDNRHLPLLDAPVLCKADLQAMFDTLKTIQPNLLPC